MSSCCLCCAVDLPLGKSQTGHSLEDPWEAEHYCAECWALPKCNVCGVPARVHVLGMKYPAGTMILCSRCQTTENAKARAPREEASIRNFSLQYPGPSLIEPHMTVALAGHWLVKLADANGVLIYRMERFGTRTHSLLLLFTPEGIVLVGDLRFTDERGLISQFGYGLDWWTGEMSEDYLCGKFLTKTWQPELLLRNLRERAGDPEEPENMRRMFDSLIETLAGGVGDFGDTAERARQLGVEPESLRAMGTAYDSVAAGWLCAVQRRFRELYHGAQNP